MCCKVHVLIGSPRPGPAFEAHSDCAEDPAAPEAGRQAAAGPLLPARAPGRLHRSVGP